MKNKRKNAQKRTPKTVKNIQKAGKRKNTIAIFDNYKATI